MAGKMSKERREYSRLLHVARDRARRADAKGYGYLDQVRNIQNKDFFPSQRHLSDSEVKMMSKYLKKQMNQITAGKLERQSKKQRKMEQIFNSKPGLYSGKSLSTKKFGEFMRAIKAAGDDAFFGYAEFYKSKNNQFTNPKSLAKEFHDFMLTQRSEAKQFEGRRTVFSDLNF